MTGRHDLSDREWEIIAPLLPNKPREVARVDDRRVIDGIFFILRTGAPWCDLPERYGPRRDCQEFRVWAGHNGTGGAPHGSQQGTQHPGRPARSASVWRRSEDRL